MCCCANVQYGFFNCIIFVLDFIKLLIALLFKTLETISGFLNDDIRR